MFVFASVLALVYYFAPKYGQSNLIVYVLICSLAGSLSVIGVKVVSICTSEIADILHTYAGSGNCGQADTRGK